MNVHIALYQWKSDVSDDQIKQALEEVESLANKIPGILDIVTWLNTTKYAKGYSHIILVRGKDQQAIDNYRNHPDHQKVARVIDEMEDHGIGVDLSVDK